jgi:hypothetical protein
MHVSIKEFIRTGYFGTVTIGMTRAEVIQALGTPDNDHHFSSDAAGLYYAWYEFFYDRATEKVHGIQNDHLAAFPCLQNKRVSNKHALLPDDTQFEIDLWFLKPGFYTTHDEVLEHLNATAISYIVKPDPYNEGGLLLQTESGVTMDFVSYVSKKGKTVMVLNGMRLFEGYGLK